MDFGDFMGLAVTLGILFVVFPAVLFKGIAHVKAAKAKTGAGGDALRMSELHTMIEEAVAQETAALRARVEVLEEIATARHDDFKLLDAPPTSRLTLPAPDEAEAVAVPRTRTRA